MWSFVFLCNTKVYLLVLLSKIFPTRFPAPLGGAMFIERASFKDSSLQRSENGPDLRTIAGKTLRSAGASRTFF
jgi:hypothetical protein